MMDTPPEEQEDPREEATTEEEEEQTEEEEEKESEKKLVRGESKDDSNENTKEEEEQPASVCETEEGSEDYFADVGFMFEASQPVRFERFQWETVDTSRSITVGLHVVDDTPGALQSGHYLWPGAPLLAEYLVKTPSSTATSNPTNSIVELGAGCALASLIALQVFAAEVIVITDHDPGTLVRARDNLETTLQMVVDAVDDNDDEDLNTAINEIASVPVEFEPFEWGSPVIGILERIQEHIPGAASVDLVLGTDLIYARDVVEPLLQSAAQLIGETGRFLLSQSFAYDNDTEAEIDRVCAQVRLKRTILQDDDDNNAGVKRIQEFRAITDERLN